MCHCSKALPQGSRIGRSCKLLPMRINEGDQMVVTMTDGEDDTQLLHNVTPSIRNDGTQLSRKWLLQEDGSYKLVILEKLGSTIDSSMIHSSSEKPEPRVSQTWGIIATLIKQQEQLNESHLKTTDNSLIAMDKTHATISALTKSEVVTNNYDNDDNSSECSDTLDIEHDVFRYFTSKGDDPDIDILDLIQIEGSPALRIRIRTLLEKYRGVFATTLPSEPASIPPFKLNVDKEKWEQFSNRGPPRVQNPAKEAEIRKQVDELLRKKVIEPSEASYYSQVILASKLKDEWRS
jgi:hypothetical protein